MATTFSTTERLLYHSNKMAADRNCLYFWFSKPYLHIIICQHGVYLENEIAGSNEDGFRFVNREFK